MSALLLVAFAARIGCSAFAAVLAPFIFLTCFPVVNDYCCGLIDSGEVLCLLCFLNAVAARKWSLIPAIVAVGALAKETGLLFMITILAVYWIIGYLSRKEMKNPAVSCGASSIPKEEYNRSRLLTPKQASGNAQTLGFNRPLLVGIVLSVISGVVAISLVRNLVGVSHYAPHEFSVKRILAMVSPSYIFHCLRAFFTSSGALVYTFIFLLPAGLMRIKKLPLWFTIGSASMGVVVFAAGAYADISRDLFRPLFTTLGPMLSISGSVFIEDILVGSSRKESSRHD
jgi:hypothetical protein